MGRGEKIKQIHWVQLLSIIKSYCVVLRSSLTPVSVSGSLACFVLFGPIQLFPHCQAALASVPLPGKHTHTHMRVCVCVCACVCVPAWISTPPARHASSAWADVSTSLTAAPASSFSVSGGRVLAVGTQWHNGNNTCLREKRRRLFLFPPFIILLARPIQGRPR